MPLSVQADDLQGLGDVNGEKGSAAGTSPWSTANSTQHSYLVAHCRNLDRLLTPHNPQPTIHDPRYVTLQTMSI